MGLNRLRLSFKGRARPEGSGKPSVPIEVLDHETGIQTIYPSISEAARAIGITQSGISMAFKQKPGESSIFMKKKRYQITKLSSI
jgi:hypothetical protein